MLLHNYIYPSSFTLSNVYYSYNWSNIAMRLNQIYFFKLQWLNMLQINMYLNSILFPKDI